MPLRDKQVYLSDLEARLDKARAEATQATSLTDRVSERADRSRFVLGQKRNRFAVMDLLNEVTRLLPDDTWVLQFGRRGDQMTVSGYSVKPSSLIGILEDSRMFTQVRFSSPVTADPRVGKERFNISAVVPKKRATGN